MIFFHTLAEESVGRNTCREMPEEKRRGRPRRQEEVEETSATEVADYSSMTVAELRAACVDAGLDAAGILCDLLRDILGCQYVRMLRMRM